MESNANPAVALLGFWMIMQLVAMLALLLGGIYVLYCLGRAAAGLDRLASAVEEWVARTGDARSTQGISSSGYDVSTHAAGISSAQAHTPPPPLANTPLTNAPPASAPPVPAPEYSASDEQRPAS